MPTVTWAHSGGDFLTDISINPPAGVVGGGDATFAAAVTTWNGTGNENGDTGTINVTTDPTPTTVASVAVGVQLEDPGLDPATAINTIQIVFNWAATNGPMGTATAAGAINSNWDGSDEPQGAGSSTGTYDRTVDGVTFGTPTIGDLLGIAGIGGIIALGFNWTGTYSAGTFSAHNRRFACSNFRIVVDYGSDPVVTDVSPAKGDAAGGTVVTLTGTDFTGATTVLFGETTASGVVVTSDTSITCVAPEHTAGPVTVSVS